MMRQECTSEITPRSMKGRYRAVLAAPAQRPTPYFPLPCFQSHISLLTESLLSRRLHILSPPTTRVNIIALQCTSHNGSSRNHFHAAGNYAVENSHASSPALACVPWRTCMCFAPTSLSIYFINGNRFLQCYDSHPSCESNKRVSRQYLTPAVIILAMTAMPTTMIPCSRCIGL